jgi:hypothetical protein
MKFKSGGIIETQPIGMKAKGLEKKLHCINPHR